jgi:hypothetical protein
VKKPKGRSPSKHTKESKVAKLIALAKQKLAGAGINLF